MLTRAAKITVWAAGLTCAIGLFALDAMASRQDFQMIAELAPAASNEGRFTEQRAAGDALLGRTCIQDRCIAHIRNDAGTRTFGPAFDQDAKLRVFRSPRQQALLLVADHTPVAIMPDAPSAWEWHAPSVLDTGLWLRAFPTVVTTAVLGWVFALMLLMWRRRVAHQLGVIASAKEGRIDDGWLRTSDGSPPMRVGGFDNGAVLALATAQHALAYRGDQRDGDVALLDGDREDNERPLLRRARRLDIATITVAAAVGMPLLAALVVASLT